METFPVVLAMRLLNVNNPGQFHGSAYHRILRLQYHVKCVILLAGSAEPSHDMLPSSKALNKKIKKFKQNCFIIKYFCF